MAIMASDIITYGKLVTLTYSISDEQGRLMEQSDLPMTYVFGGDTELLGGADKAMLGKCAGDAVEVTVPPEQGFGERSPELTFTDDLENVPPEYRRIGAEVEMRNDAGESKTFYVTRIEDGKLTVDGNHPLAGKTLKLSIRILDVRDATSEDAMMSGAQTAPPDGVRH